MLGEFQRAAGENMAEQPSILIIEDEYLLAMELEQPLRTRDLPLSSPHRVNRASRCLARATNGIAL